MPTAEQLRLAPWMGHAEGYKGLKEISGSRHNPVIVKFFAESGNSGVKNDETAWCSAFENAMFWEAGPEFRKFMTRSLLARSWLEAPNCDEIDPDDARYGDIVVFTRAGSTWQGHVAFFVGWNDNGTMRCLGGNQSNSVNITSFGTGNLLGIRRPQWAPPGEVEVKVNPSEPAVAPELLIPVADRPAPAPKPGKTPTITETAVTSTGIGTAVASTDDWMTAAVVVALLLIAAGAYWYWSRR